MIRITTLLVFSFILLFGSQYASAQLAGPGTRPHSGVYRVPGTTYGSIPATIPRTTAPSTTPIYVPSTPGYVPSQPGYVPSQPVYVPSQPVYVPSAPAYTPGYAPSYSPVYVPSNNAPVYAPEGGWHHHWHGDRDRDHDRGDQQDAYRAGQGAAAAQYRAQTEQARWGQYNAGRHQGWYRHNDDGDDH